MRKTPVKRLGKAGWLGLLLFALALSGCASRGPDKQAVAGEAEATVERVLDAFMESFNARDPARHVATLQFPHHRLAGGALRSWATPGEGQAWMAQTFPRLVASGWDRSEWLERKIITASASKIHVATRFRRLRADGSEIGRYASLYILTNVDGRWAVKLRSSYL